LAEILKVELEYSASLIKCKSATQENESVRFKQNLILTLKDMLNDFTIKEIRQDEIIQIFVDNKVIEIDLINLIAKCEDVFLEQAVSTILKQLKTVY
jgi:hypothetical protein